MDNKEEIKENKKEKTEVCKVCGSKAVHSRQYSFPTMSCIVYLRGIIDQLKGDLAWSKGRK